MIGSFSATLGSATLPTRAAVVPVCELLQSHPSLYEVKKAQRLELTTIGLLERWRQSGYK